MDYADDILEQQQEYEQRVRHEFCDCCQAEITATRASMERQGWTLGPGYAICGNHD